MKHVQYILIRDWITDSSSWVCYTNMVPYFVLIVVIHIGVFINDEQWKVILSVNQKCLIPAW